MGTVEGRLSKKWYVELFENFGEYYDNEPYTKGTKGEVDFIEKEIGYDKSKRILDVGCGTGRHCIELGRRGYNVVGVDLSKSMLDKARRKSTEENLHNVEFIQCDARKLNCIDQFDLVLSICEGAFSLMETDEMDFQILENASKALKKGGKFILTTPSAVYALTHKLEGEFDIVTFREEFKLEAFDGSGNKKTIDCESRRYTYTEIDYLLRQIGFKRVEFLGFKLGAFSREREPSKDDYELLVVAEK